MNALKHDLQHALRLALKAPGFTAVAVMVLAIGIGVNTAMFSVAQEILLRPLWGRGSEVVGVYSMDRKSPGSFQAFSYPTYADVRDSGVFQSVLAQTYTMVASTTDGAIQRQLAAVVSSNYFSTLNVRLAAGRAFTMEEERPGARIPVAIATYASWKATGLNPKFVGSLLRLNGQDYNIVGVAPEGFSGSMALVSPGVFLPLGVFEAVVDNAFRNNGRGLSDRTNTGLSVAGRLANGLTLESANTQLDAVSRRLEARYPVENRNLDVMVDHLNRMSNSPGPGNNAVIVTFSAFLLSLSGIVLVIACLNMANMLLARGTARRKEIALRLALGAVRWRIVRQLLTESFVLASTGAVFGLLFSFVAMRWLVVSLSSALPFRLAIDPVPNAAVLAATIVFTAIGTMAFGLGPALRLSRRDLVADLKDRGTESASVRRRFSARNIMVVAQVALSLALLTAGGVFARTTFVAAQGRPGYSYDRLLLARLDVKLAGLDAVKGAAVYEELLTRVRALFGVSSATVISSVPYGDSLDGRLMERVGDGTSQARARIYRIIGTGYFETLGLKMVRGRSFTVAEESSPAAPRVAIVDQAFAQRLFGDEEPIGQMIRVARDSEELGTTVREPMEVVGIAPPMRAEILDNAPVAHVYVPFARNYRSGMFLQVRLAPGVDETTALNRIRETIRSTDQDLPILSLSTMQEFHASSIELWALGIGARTFAGLGVLALLLASIGLYGVRAYIVSQRTREIGIRMALGAHRGDVLRQVLGEGAYLLGAGLAIGAPLAVLASISLRSVFAEIGGVDFGALGIATLALTVAGVIASAVPARRATRVQPLTALRTE